MSRIILTTCGTSLYTSSCWEGLNDPPLSTISIEDRKTLRKKQSKCEGAIADARREGITGETFAKGFDPVSWKTLDRLRDLPAELASLRIIIEALNSGNKKLNKNDKIILLHSDNDDGNFCAEVVEKVLRELLADVKIELDEVRGLDPKDPKGLVTALQDIWTKYRNEVKRNGVEFIFNLTGGYKATSMILAAQAAVLSEAANITVAYLHEDASPDILFRIHWDNNIPRFGFWSKNSSGTLSGP